MKGLILISSFFVIPLATFASDFLSENFDYYRYTTNFNGSAYNGKAILSYGEGGILLSSTNGGQNWEQVNLSDSFNIISVTNIGRAFFGIASGHYLIRSFDDGKKWEVKDFGINSHFSKLVAYRGELYCMNGDKILIFNQEFKAVKELTIVPINNDFCIAGDNLYFTAGLGKIKLINLINNMTEEIDLSKFDIVSSFVPEKFFPEGNNIFFNLGSSLYFYDGRKVTLALKPIQKGLYASNGNEVFQLYNVINSSENIDSLYFIKIDRNSQTYVHVKKTGNDRYISALVFKSLQFLSPDTIIAVGKDKLIYMSFDRGRTWVLKSNYNAGIIGKIRRFDMLNAVKVEHFGKLIKTNDGGATWLPQRNYNPVLSKGNFSDIDNGTIFFFRDKDHGYFGKMSQIKKDTNAIYTIDNCETAAIIRADNIGGYDIGNCRLNAAINNKCVIMTAPSRYGAHLFTMIMRLNDTIGAERRYKLDSAQILFFDSFESEKLYAVAVNYKYPRQSGQFGYEFDSVYYSLISSVDTAKTWIKEWDFRIPESNNILYPYKRISDYFYFSFQYRNPKDSSAPYTDAYMLNVKSAKLQKVFTLRNLNISQYSFVPVGNKTIVTGAYFEKSGIAYEILENDDIINHPTEWKSVAPKERYYYLIQSNDDSLYTIIGYDSLYKSNVMWFAKPKTLTDVVEKLGENPYFYLSAAVPNPTTGKTRLRIYQNNFRDIEQADIRTYDILGQDVTSMSTVSLNKINFFSGDIYWESAGLSPGVYFINVRIGSEMRSSPVVIYK